MFRSRHLARLGAAAVLLAACSGTPSGTDTPSATATSDRLAAIQDARAAIGPVAVRLGETALTLAGRVEDLVAQPSPAAVDAVEAAAGPVEEAADAAGDLTLDTGVADVAAAADALERAAGAAREQAGAARGLAALTTALRDVDDRLAALVDTWDEPGSRSQQLARLDETAAAADALVDDVGALPAADCAPPVEVRADAAQAVADATRELREMVAGYQGEAYDARRAELDADPYGLGAPLAEAGAITADRCDLVATVADRAEDVTVALAEVEAALNPSDLAS